MIIQWMQLSILLLIRIVLASVHFFKLSWLVKWSAPLLRVYGWLFVQNVLQIVGRRIWIILKVSYVALFIEWYLRDVTQTAQFFGLFVVAGVGFALRVLQTVFLDTGAHRSELVQTIWLRKWLLFLFVLTWEFLAKSAFLWTTEDSRAGIYFNLLLV